MQKRLVSILLALCMVLTMLPGRALATETVNSGTCGDSLTWTLDSDGVLTISGTGEMYDCSSLDEIPWYSIRTNIKRLVIGNGVTGIGGQSFSDCSNLTSVTISDSVISIGWSAFSHCSNLTSITIPNSVTNMGTWAFSDCSNLTSIIIPSSVIHIGDCAFTSCSKLTSIIVSDGNSNYISEEGVLFNKQKSTLICYPAGKSGVYTIPDSVVSIEDSAFFDCENLTGVVIPDSVTSIGDSAFSSCYGLTNITFPNGITSIGSQAFMSCNRLTEITIPNSVTSIGSQAFDGCTGLTSITVPSSVTSIGSHAFFMSYDYNGALNDAGPIGGGYSFEFGWTDEIPANTFSSCQWLTDITIPNSITSIGDAAFNGCTNLTSITLPNSITSIGDGSVFRACGLTSIIIPDSVTRIGDGAFLQCSKLTSIVIPDSVTSLGSHVFAECVGLTNAGPIDGGYSYEFGWTDKIPDEAFRQCSGLTSVTIPDSISCIGRAAFSGCSSLSDVYYAGTEAQWNEIVIETGNEVLTSATIHYNGEDTDTSIIRFYPANGSTFDHADTSSDTRMRIFFDREVADGGGGRPELDFSVGTLEVHKASDDSIVYRVQYGTEVSLWNVDGSPTAVVLQNAAAALDYDTEYYVTMPEGFIKLVDGSVSLAIEKRDWAFRTIAEVECAAPLVDLHGQFQFVSDIIDGDMTYGYNYDENWFFEDSTTYQHDLVKMSIRAALAAYGAEGTKSSSKNIEALMKDLAFSNIDPNYPPPSVDTIGYAIGSKNIVSDAGEKCALIMVAVRGGRYYDEWGSNFALGISKEHEGFASAASKVLEGIQRYIDTHRNELQKNIKIWIVGYSRGAATTNLVAKMLDDGEISGIKSKNVYAFCFECPQNTTNTSRSSSKYNNIINIVNPIDLVPKVAMSAWGYGRYGKTYYLPYKTGLIDFTYSSQKAAMKEQYENLLRPYRTDEITADAFIPGNTRDILLENDTIPNFLAHEFNNPEDYYVVCQDFSVNAAVKAFGVGSTIPKKEQAETFISGYLKFMGIEELSAFGGEIVTALKEYFFESHYGELCLSWLDSLEGDVSYADPKYRILYVNCPVDVEVYNSNNTLVASIHNDIVAEIEHGVAAYIDFDGQKIIALPNSEQYTIEITATDNGAVTYTATQYNMDTGRTEKVVSYYEVDVVKGDELTGLAENLDNVTDAAYPLYLNDSDSSLTPSVNQNGDSVQQYTVNVSVSGNGSITGGGNYVTGEFARVTATANSGETFLGWYVNNTLVSSDAEYRFLVNKNVSITAKFTQNTTSPDVPITPVLTYSGGNSTTGNSTHTTHNISVPSFTDGTVTVNPTSASSGNTVTLTAIPDEGYALASLTVTDSKGNELELTNKGNNQYTFTMPNSNVIVSATFAPVSSEPTTPTENTSDDETYLFPFTDVLKTDWFCSAVEYVFNNELMSGTAPYTFDPQGKMSRAMVWTVLGRMADADVDGSVSPWYAKAQEWATANNVSDGTNPNNSISRQELMTMLWRYIGSPAATADLSKFSDSGAVAEWANGAMQWAVSTGLLVGDNGRLNPAGEARRCEVATIFMRFCENIVK